MYIFKLPSWALIDFPAVHPVHPNKLPFEVPLKQTFPTYAKLKIGSKVLLPSYPLLSQIFLPVNVQNLICFTPAVQNVVFDSHATAVHFALSVLPVHTIEFAYQSKTAKLLSSSLPTLKSRVPSGLN